MRKPWIQLDGRIISPTAVLGDLASRVDRNIRSPRLGRRNQAPGSWSDSVSWVSLLNPSTSNHHPHTCLNMEYKFMFRSFLLTAPLHFPELHDLFHSAAHSSASFALRLSLSRVIRRPYIGSRTRTNQNVTLTTIPGVTNAKAMQALHWHSTLILFFLIGGLICAVSSFITTKDCKGLGRAT
jgi:hypothetical protein